MGTITAIVSAYYAEKYMQRRIDNLLPEVDEIIIVCQKGSKEYDIAYSNRAIHNQINGVITPDIPTIYDAWNMAIKQADGDYITNANTDDYIKKGGYRTMAKALDEHPDWGLVYADSEVIEESGTTLGFFKFAEGGYRQLLDQCFIGPMPMWRKRLHDKFGYFDEKMTVAGDYEMWLRLAYNDVKLKKLPGVLGRYTQRVDSLERRNPEVTGMETHIAHDRYYKQPDNGLYGQVVIGMPTTRPIDLEYVISLITTKDFYYIPQKNQPADVARNIIVRKFLEMPEKPGFLLFTDSDATWLGKDAIDRLLERNLPMVCGIFFNKDMPPMATMGPSAGETTDGHHLYSFGKTARAIVDYFDENEIEEEGLHNALVLPKTDKDLFPIDGCGMHFVLIRRDVLEKLKPPYFQYISEAAGEDFYFCQKVRAAGFPMYADLSVYSGHIVGDSTFGVRQFLMFARHSTMAMEDQKWEI